MIKFTKMQGIGNDYIYLDCTKQTVAEPERLAQKLSDRHFGVGSDGLVLILSSDIADFKMRMFNADGSEGKMCGNAARCIGKYVYEKGLTDKTELTLETLSGIKTLYLHLQEGKVDTVSVDMGAPRLTPGDIPLLADSAMNVPLSVDGITYNGLCVSMGNPHCVIFCSDVEAVPLVRHGSVIEKLPIFPEGVNVEFVEICSDTHLKVRVWERGSGETLACGTGACAAAVAAVLTGVCKKEAEIQTDLPGGTLRVCCAQSVMLRGGAEFVFEGTI